MVREVGILTCDRLTTRQVLGLKLLAIGGEDELGFVGRSLWAVAQCGEGFANLTGRASRDVDVTALKDAAREIRLVGPAFPVLPKPVDSRLLIPEGGEELEGELRPIKRLGRELGDGFFDLDGVHKKPDSSVEPTRQATLRGEYG